MHRPALSVRIASEDDAELVGAIMTASAAALFPRFYAPDVVPSAVRHIAVVDRALLADGTYFVVDADGVPAGCGGWSRRDKLFTGSDPGLAGDARLLDPRTEPARVRAMFVRPEWTRHGVGRRVLALCERAASEEGFVRATLMATLPGVPLYRAAGWTEVGHVDVVLPDGVRAPCIRMEKALAR